MRSAKLGPMLSSGCVEVVVRRRPRYQRVIDRLVSPLMPVLAPFEWLVSKIWREERAAEERSHDYFVLVRNARGKERSVGFAKTEEEADRQRVEITRTIASMGIDRWAESMTNRIPRSFFDAP